MHLLNSGAGFTLFSEAALKDTYVDKTMMVDALYRYTKSAGKYVCVTRPRRFGKSVMANMIAAFFDRRTGEKSRVLFERYCLGTLKNAQNELYAAHPDGPEARKLCWPVQGGLSVICINMIDLLSESVQSYEALLARLDLLLREDLRQAYPGLDFSHGKDLTDLLVQTGESFVFCDRRMGCRF